jgi:hypothetical protein
MAVEEKATRGAHKGHTALKRPPFESIALHLQGGGALGAYQSCAANPTHHMQDSSLGRRLARVHQDELRASRELSVEPRPPRNRDLMQLQAGGERPIAGPLEVCAHAPAGGSAVPSSG